MKLWPTILVGLVLFFYLDNYKIKEEPYIDILKDGCLIYSLAYKHAITAQEMLRPYMWTRVLAIHFYDGIGHAVTVMVYEKNTYVYDPNIGSFPISGFPLYDPKRIAEICFPDRFIKRAFYLEPTILLHYEKPSSKLF